jgi:zinc and cadmium transporter
MSAKIAGHGDPGAARVMPPAPSTALLALASVVVVSAVSLVGVLAIALREGQAGALARVFVSFAVGALLGDAFIHIIPEAFTGGAAARTPLRSSLLILGGMMVFFVVEKLVRHGHDRLAGSRDHRGRPAVAAINVLGDAIHNFIDGVLIGASYLVSPVVGVSTTIAVVLHEIPQEIGDFGILVDSGLSVRRALLVNLGSASVALVGTAVALVAGAVARDVVVATLLPVTAGGFVYLAAATLIPGLQHDRSLRALLEQTVLIAAGIAVMGFLTLLD